ncbi:hypothetical protein PPTG_19479 [Phytophthora nicotianae INRA-310]|uniref:RxLR effector protein n=1 Tax=Phytophthora nicotianae (strain INRA-310) TaxID=761204 RepID=W2PEV0_PHYN3|nr:hypothetical protein PPTG_19479 [Phytophthora nicotianae INRA-310]ETM98524.1 hypothetical protein PPTG_19479 [Phytophthora nicotianae INRA-310]
MRWYHVLLILVSSFQTISNAFSTSPITTVASPAHSISTSFAVTETARRRLLRVVNRANAESNSFKDVGYGENTGDVSGYSGYDKSSIKDLEERVTGTEAFQKLKSSKTFKSFSQGVTKATNTFSVKISPALPMKAKLQVWSNNGKSVSFVRKELGMDKLDDALLKQAKNFQFYDDYVTSQLPIWAKNELTLDDIVSQLGLRGLSGSDLTSNPNFKYYDQYLEHQALVWATKDLDLDDVLVRLDLNILPAAERLGAVNFKFYEEFVAGLMRSWMEKGTPLDDVMAKLKLDKLTGEELLKHPNYRYYKNHVKNYLRVWAFNGESLDDVAVWLGLENMQGKLLESQPNYAFLKKYWDKSTKYEEQEMLKRRITSFQVWDDLQVFRVKQSRRKNSETYKAYKHYVNLIDDYIIRLKDRGFTEDELPRMTSKNAAPDEMMEKTYIWTQMRRPEWYVKFSLGLDGLGENALKEAANFQYYEYYLRAMKAVNPTVQ